ncbi:SEC-C metal-binding domain-containing protein [Paenibacillus sp. J5C_2022]|uniref:YecA family protein n=1 Tax=Paenibacillus sp. J5C2022 TaxID=2977129 RepID=UPI0021D14822|nr:SEC-C metal-binding domain-containing protein [Paenibacillus sp. J5C2022]MCU6709611.1 SEC-C metal-binding domain-containing protein [Paenibacillus sp. J5C2022]
MLALHEEKAHAWLEEQAALASKLKEMRGDSEDSKRWRAIEATLALQEGLSRLTKDELTVIRTYYKIENTSRLNKPALVDIIAQTIVERLSEVLHTLTQEQYQLLQALVRNGGHAELELDWEGELDLLLLRGLLFTGKRNGTKSVVAPQEVLEAFNKLDEAAYEAVIHRNSEWIRLARGMLHYYGTLEVSTLYELLSRLEGQHLALEQFTAVLADEIASFDGIKLNEAGLSNERVFDSRRVLNEHKLRESVPFHSFTREELLEAGEPGFVDRNASYRAFVSQLVRQYGLSAEEADELAEECVYATRIGEPMPNIAHYLGYQFDMESGDPVPLIEKLVALMNGTRQWFLKGYASDQLTDSGSRYNGPLLVNGGGKQQLASAKKVGRNEPCPCGSGKKYKKCCAK